MRQVVKRLQCYAHGIDNRWQAICVDLDIAVQGGSQEEVKRLLEEAIDSYVMDALAEEPVVAQRLLNRHAPLAVRVRLAIGYLLHTIRRRDGDEFQAGFDIACHA